MTEEERAAAMSDVGDAIMKALAAVDEGTALSVLGVTLGCMIVASYAPESAKSLALSSMEGVLSGHLLERGAA